MKGLSLSPVELSDFSADLFSDDTVGLSPLSAATNYECNSDGYADVKGRHTKIRLSNWNKLDSKRQGTKSTTKAHKFRFWLNKKNCKGPSKNKTPLSLEGFDKELRYDDIVCDSRTNNQVSLSNHRVSSRFFSSGAFSEIDQSFSSQATVCELDNEEFKMTDVDHLDGVNQSFSSQAAVYEFNNELYDTTDKADTVIITDAVDENDATSISDAFIYGFERRKEEDLTKQDQNHSDIDVFPNTEKCPLYNKIIGDKYISEYFQDAVNFSEEKSDVADVVLQQFMISDIRVKHSAGTFMGSFSDPWVDSDCSCVSWNEQEIGCGPNADFHSSFFKRRRRLRFLVHFFRNKLSRGRIDSEIQLLVGLWHSTLMREKNAY